MGQDPLTEVEGLFLTSGEGFVTLEWDDHPSSSYYNIYRDDELLIEEPLWQSVDGTYTDSFEIMANTLYAYVVVALNSNAIEGAYHVPDTITVTALPIIEDVEILGGNGRIAIEWSTPPNYAGSGYDYEIYSELDEFVKSTNLTYTHIPNLEEGVEYCFTVRSISLGGYGYSENSDIVCATPENPIGETFDWSIQIIGELIDSNGEIIDGVAIDANNLVGVDSDATDGYDIGFDVPESPPNPGAEVSIFFTYLDESWANSFDAINFGTVINENIPLTNAVIEWTARLEHTYFTQGIPRLTFYFNNIEDNTVYLNKGSFFQKIEDGYRMTLDPLYPYPAGEDIQIIVGNADPEPPENLSGFGGYREATISWEDPCCGSGLQPEYSAEAYNIWRNGELKGENIIGNTFTDRGLDVDVDYSYKVSAINIAGESEKSDETLVLRTLENRPPVSDAGMDIVLYDLEDDGEQTALLILPVYSDFSNENKSYDPDNSYEEDGILYPYPEPFDELEYIWSSASNAQYTDSELDIIIEGYNDEGKEFQLEVSDGTLPSTANSKAVVYYKGPPAPAIVHGVNLSSGLYDIELHWLESMFTGESYADLNGNLVYDHKEEFDDCGLDTLCIGDSDYTDPDEDGTEDNDIWDFEDCGTDNLCPGDSDYTDPDEDNTEGNGRLDLGERFEIWVDEEPLNNLWDDFEPFIDEVNDGVANDMYDDGPDDDPRPRPPYYNLVNEDNDFELNAGDDNIATYYKIYRDNELYVQFPADSALYLDPSADGEPASYTLLDTQKYHSTEYCYKISACNFNDLCADTEEICIFTKDRPTVTIISPNGAEIVGNGSLDVTLEFENVETISNLDIYLSYDGEFNQPIELLSTDVIGTFYQNIDHASFQGYSNEVKVRATITDEGGHNFTDTDPGGDGFASYSDESDYPFVISVDQDDHDFLAGWHLFGSPIAFENSDFYTIINNSDIGNNWMAFNQDGDNTDLILNSGDGYYLWLLNPGNMLLSGDLYSQFDISLEEGWNLISNPLIETINMGAFDILRANGDTLSMAEAISSGLVSSRMLGFDNESATHMPSFKIEPFMGYWLYAYEENLILKIQNKLEPVDISESDGSSDWVEISEPEGSSDWRMKLSAHAVGAGGEWYNPFGDIIDLGFSQNASDGFAAGEDEYHLPFNSTFSGEGYTYLKIDNSDWLSEYEELNSPYFSQDIQEARNMLYAWDIIGESLNINHSDHNQDSEIIISWDMGELNEGYSIQLYIDDQIYNMRTQEDHLITIMPEGPFFNMRIEVSVIEGGAYAFGCGNETACNYYCHTNIDCDENILPDLFIDDDSCEDTSCIGCSDSMASNYNPNAAIDLSNCEYLQSFLLSTEKNIYYEPAIENRIPINLHNYLSTDVEAIEIQLAIDPEKIIVSDIDLSSGIFQNGSSSINDSLDIADYMLTWEHGTEGILAISIITTVNLINTDPISKIFDLILEVTGDIGEQVTIDFIQSDFNAEEVNTNSQLLNIKEGLFEISGSIEYYTNMDEMVGGVVVDLVGISELTALDVAYHAESDSDLGKVLFPPVLRGEYLSVIGKEDGSLAGLSSVDASRIARYSIDLIDFSVHQKYSADVNLNGIVNAMDASAIARLIVGNADSLNEHSLSWRFVPEYENSISLFDQSFISQLFDGSEESVSDFEYPLDWIFDPLSIDMYVLTNIETIIDSLHSKYESESEADPLKLNPFYDSLKVESLFPIVENGIDQKIVGYKIGDVDGDWWSDYSNNLARESEVDSCNIFISENQSILHLPLTIEGKNLIEGIDLELNFDPEIFNLNEFEIISSTLTQDNYQTVLSQDQDGASLVIYCTSDLKNHDGILANLKFEILNTITDDTHIDINKFRVNGAFNESAGFRVIDGDSYVIAQSIAFRSREIPNEYSLSQNYPNPFNPSTNIPFALPFESDVKVNIYDVRGRLVQELVNSHFGSGYHHIAWDASHLSSGLYFIQFESSSSENSKTFSTIQKSLLIK